MENKQIDRYIATFTRDRNEWVDILVKNPNYSTAAQYIISLNSKINFLESLRTLD